MIGFDDARNLVEFAVAALALAASAYTGFRLAARQAIMPEIRAIHDRIDRHMDEEQESMTVMVTSLAYIAGSLGLDLSDATPLKEK